MLKLKGSVLISSEITKINWEANSIDALQEQVINLRNNHNVRPGRVVALPSTYAGSPRALKEKFEDAKSLMKKYGKPDLFITFTCNPKWREVTENLFPGQTANDRLT